MRKIIIILAVILIIVGLGYFLYSMLLGGETAPTVGVAGVTETNFLTAIFSEQKFTGLKQYVTLPVEAGQKGKIDPFMKF
jgi:hypothetical protein